MSLATRCSACGTIFRVVQDQLRVSEGWVRCGRCAEVFDAGEQLFDIDRQAPPPWPAVPVTVAPAPMRPPPAPVASPAFAAESSPRRMTADSTLDSRMEPQWDDEEPAATAPPVFVDERSAPISLPSSMAGRDLGPDVVLAPGLAKAAAVTATPTALTETMPLPEFMRRARRAERWRRPQVRIALAAFAALLLTLLGLQVTLQFHDAIVALYPQSQPLAQTLCKVGGCTLHPWRRIDALSVEASALNQAGPNNQYQLSVSLRNKSGVEVATPWIDLSLTDATGLVVARRTLAPGDFKSSKPSMPPGSDLPLQLLLSTGNSRVSGYSVEIFHP